MSQLQQFFERILPDDEGWVPIMSLGPGGGLSRCQWYHWPTEAEKMCEVVEKTSERDVYWSPMLFSKPSTLSSARHATKKNVKQLACVYADLDGLHPEDLFLEPTVLVKSSPEHYHAYWRLSDYSSLGNLDIEQLNRGVYQTHADTGVDRGWPLAKKLRVPGTMNTKPKYGLPTQVTVEFNDRKSYSVREFTAAYSPASTPKVDLIMEMPEVDQDGAMAIINRLKDNKIAALYADDPLPSDDWSALMYSLECSLFEAGVELADVFTVVQDAGCNKYKRDGRPDSDLWIQIQRDKARWDDDQEVQADLADAIAIEAINGESIRIPRLQDERNGLFWGDVHLINDKFDKVPQDTVVDSLAQYMNDMSSRTSKQFNYAAAMSILSAVLGSDIRVRTSFGRLSCNLYTLLLGRTTRDKKSTTASYVKHFLRRVGAEFNLDLIGPEDHTPEALAQHCGERPGESLLVILDEVQDLFARAMRSGSYMDGEIGFLTKAYDGYIPSIARKQKGHEYRKETPFSLSILCMGILDQAAGNLKVEKIASGFIPRCLPVLPEPTEFDPARTMDDFTILSDTDDETLQRQDNMFNLNLRLLTLAKHHWRQEREALEPFTVEGEDARALIAFEEKALDRIRDAGNMCAVLADQHPLYSEYLIPCVERLGLSILRMAALIAAAEQQHTVKMRHAVKAVQLAEVHLKAFEAFVACAADSDISKDVAQVEAFLAAQPNKTATRDAVLGHLLRRIDNTRRADEIVDAGARMGRLTVPVVRNEAGKKVRMVSLKQRD